MTEYASVSQRVLKQLLPFGHGHLCMHLFRDANTRTGNSKKNSRAG